MASQPEKVVYEAVSHRWGVGTDDHFIRIQEADKHFDFKVHSDLYEALVALRYSRDSRSLWIDTVCINQQDLPERSKQVARMHDVYSDAENVCIWLGSEDVAQKSTEALEFLQKEGLDVYEFDDKCKDEQFIQKWKAFLMLLKREWFSRRWVVQEVSLAQRATVHCGSTFVQWEDFAAAVSLLSDVDSSSKKLSKAAKKLESMNNPDDLFSEVGALTAVRLVQTANDLRRNAAGGHSRTRTLEEIVARLAMFQSGEPRDYIYALLALAKDSQPYAGIPEWVDGKLLTRFQQRALHAVTRLLPRAHHQDYIVDYEQEVVDVFQQFIAFAISKSADPAMALDIICRPFAPTGVEGLPSWIPVVSELPHAPIRLGKGHFRMERQRGDPFVSMPDTATHYNAAGQRPYDKSKVRFRKRGKAWSMFVEGFILDKVDKVEAASQRGFIPEDWIALSNQLRDKEVFWRTLVADRGPKGDVPGIYGNAIKAALRYAHNGLDIGGHMKDHPSSIVSVALPHVLNTIWGRCLIQTARGHLGLGPKKLEQLAKTQAKLLVCIIHGCSVPVILEQCEKTDEDMDREAREDEDDRVIRQIKAEPFIKKWYRRYHGSAGNTRTRSGREPGPRTRSAGVTKNAGRAKPGRGRAARAPSVPKDEPKDESPPRHYYRLVGESFIHGMMQGEAIKWQNDTTAQGGGRVQAQIFELR